MSNPVDPARGDAPAPGWRELRPVLQGGGIALLLIEVPGDIEQARSVGRETAAGVLAALAGSRLHQSRSASVGLAAIAFSARAALGVDVERIRPELVDDDLLALVLHPQERRTQPADAANAFFALWTRKEAVLKALGTGLAVSPGSFQSGWRGNHAARWQRVDMAAAGAAQVQLRSVAAPHGYAAALATTGAPQPLHAWRWTLGD